MKIGLLNFASYYVVNSNKKDNLSFKNSLSMTNGLQNDVFVKSKKFHYM